MLMNVLIPLLLFLQSACASVLHVPAEFSSVQQAVEATQTGDTVYVARGHYFEQVLVAEHPLTLASEYFFTGDTTAIYETILDAEHEGQVLRIDDDAVSVVLSGFSIINGASGSKTDP